MASRVIISVRYVLLLCHISTRTLPTTNKLVLIRIVGLELKKKMELLVNSVDFDAMEDWFRAKYQSTGLKYRSIHTIE